jgi:hypothetical protein
MPFYRRACYAHRHVHPTIAFFSAPPCQIRHPRHRSKCAEPTHRATKTHTAPQFPRAGAKRTHFPPLPGYVAPWLLGVRIPPPSQVCQISERTQQSVPNPPRPPAARTGLSRQPRAPVQNEPRFPFPRRPPRSYIRNIIRTRPPPADSLTLYPGARTIPRPRFLLTNPRGNACKI